MNHYTETVSGGEVTATFVWRMYFLGKGWDIESDEGGDGLLDFDTVRVFADSSAKGPPSYVIPLEAFFPISLRGNESMEQDIYPLRLPCGQSPPLAHKGRLIILILN